MIQLRTDRSAYATESLPLIGSMLQQLDRNPLSKTAGCFDRQYWHYRTMDFPCGMSQEFAYPIALAYSLDIEGSPYFQQARLREWALSAIRFASKSAHSDGSCDDYYPFERALGAAVFSLYAMSETYRLLDADDPDLRAFLVKRAEWTESHGESGILSNHHAIAAAALHSVAKVSGEERFATAAAKKVEEVLGYQHQEGWFQEYSGFDPGYQTVTIDFLARYWKDSGNDSVLPALGRAVDLLETIQHPDGSFGGEYAARNTYHTQPHGFELLAPQFEAAGRVADRFLDALHHGLRVRNDDDRLQGHHVYPYLLAWRDHHPRSTVTPPEPANGRAYLPECGFLIERRQDDFLIAGLKKGAPFRYYRGRELAANDSGITLVDEEGNRLVSHLVHECTVTEANDEQTMISEGSFFAARGELMTPFKMVVLRLLMLTIGRFFRTFVRKLLQKRLILGKDPAPFRFERRLMRHDDGWSVTDTIVKEDGAPTLKHLRLGVGETSIYIAVSQPWDKAWLHQPVDLDAMLPQLASQGVVTHKRSYRGRELGAGATTRSR